MVYSRQICPVSKIYDAKHLRTVGLNCPYKHKIYHWVAKISSNHCVIGDSIIKFLKVTNQADVISFPGINIDGLYWKIRLSGKRLSQYKIIVLHVGTNDVEAHVEGEILRKYQRLLSAVRKCNGKAIIGISSILPRPKNSVELNNKVITINRELKRLSKSYPRTEFIHSFRPFVLKNKEINTDLYAADKLHLSFKGSIALKKNLIGNIKNLQGIV